MLLTIDFSMEFRLDSSHEHNVVCGEGDVINYGTNPLNTHGTYFVL